MNHEDFCPAHYYTIAVDIPGASGKYSGKYKTTVCHSNQPSSCGGDCVDFFLTKFQTSESMKV